MTTTTVSLSPEIKQHFSATLLSTPTFSFRDSLRSFDIMWKEVEKLWKKLEKCPQKKIRCEALKKEIMELYERAKVKEKECEGQKDHKTQGFMYSVTVSSRMADDIYFRLRFGKKGGKFWRNPKK